MSHDNPTLAGALKTGKLPVLDHSEWYPLSYSGTSLKGHFRLKTQCKNLSIKDNLLYNFTCKGGRTPTVKLH